jgi:hypothetical protein
MTVHLANPSTRSTWINSFAGWAAVASGAVGIVSFVCLIAYLTTQVDQLIKSGIMPPAGRILITTNYVGVLVQALLMLPVALAVNTLTRDRAPNASRIFLVVGIVALLGVALARLLLLFSPAVSDILFMGPMGFVGVWLIAVNWLSADVMSTVLRILGMTAGLGLMILGASFFFLGGLAVLTDGPFAYANNVNFHIGIRIGGFPGFILYPIWAILLGRRLLRMQGARSV